MKTTQQTADLLGLAQSTIRVYIMRGKIKATKVGRDWVIDHIELQRLKAKYKTTADEA